jgi:hypothetical protein
MAMRQPMGGSRGLFSVTAWGAASSPSATSCDRWFGLAAFTYVCSGPLFAPSASGHAVPRILQSEDAHHHREDPIGMLSGSCGRLEKSQPDAVSALGERADAPRHTIHIASARFRRGTKRATCSRLGDAGTFVSEGLCWNE